MKPEHSQLILDYLDGKISAENIDRLNALLRDDPEARAFLRTQSCIDTQLREMALNHSNKTSPARRGIDARGLGMLAMAAALVICAGLIWYLFPRDPGPQRTIASIDGPVSVPMETGAPVAVLKSATNVKWQDAAQGRPTGSPLTAGWLRIAEGTLQIEFLSGARLLVNGPAALRLDTENSAYLESGKVSAYVPEPAQGFVLHSPQLQIKDLGTSFGLEIAADESPEVHCFDGAVELFTEPGQKDPLLLSGQKALQLKGGNLLEVPVRPRDFPNGEELSRRAMIDTEQRMQQWNAVNQKLAADPQTVVFYTFDQENEWSRSVTNRASTAATKSDATLVGAGWTGGRWKGKSGLEFRTRGDRLRFSVPGTFDLLSMSAWIRVDSLPNDYNSLLLPTHYQVGNLHWNIERGGEMRLTQFANPINPTDPTQWNGPVSGKGFNGLDFGRWMQIVTTCNVRSGEIIHYRDGEMVGNGRFTNPLPIVMGEMEFGNWGADGKSPDNAWVLSQQPNYRIRNFVGRLDHLVILSRILTPQEIAEMYRAGSP